MIKIDPKKNILSKFLKPDFWGAFTFEVKYLKIQTLFYSNVS